ncbi:peptide ABC transporter substrate-binding protein [Actinacidiphila bryophytorum]|uniref:Peptide/nickel transport system substrate-binding protein/oligopeptide transport system substrate-binding protein n=1 Tax=Actinacidiphila bryophytorum TaxID=1436133 RepID=A0A9W4EC95_9ACTN|nr:ABC transporter substrate-binding protein [Actinacidiphila bryophytorum]MBM9440040.1 ABC transporter substrate-binding protein [Actinacidiphila bryophytorum]MBN6544306.1 ABC transporter substrate-binding protein [Actinacidiphila bryophytorum]CAG7603490.1 Peptide/nickel transport system substrate-binding protein/oligopeptide transport system substrate-binding protein [Actinacidiphila bryophytorum]
MRGAKSAKWVVGAAVIALAATACSSSDDSGSKDKAKSSSGSSDGIVRAWWGDPQNPLEPANTNEVQGGKVLDMIFMNLKEYDATGKAQLEAADSITTTDQQNFTIKIKPDLKFSDGTPVTSSSFVDAWNYGALVTNKQLNSYFFADIDGYKAVHPDDETAAPTAKTMSGLKVVDDHTFTVKLSQKFSTWPDRLGYKAFAPLPKEFFDNHDAYLKKPIGDGPYMIESYTKGASMKLVPNPNYTGPSKPKNKGVLLKVYTSSETAYADLQSGQLDVLDDIPAADLPHVKNDLSGRYLNQPAGIIQTFSFPMYKPEWSKPGMDKVRLGISMAIDRKTITDKIFGGTRTPAQDLTSPVLGAAGGYSTSVCGEACTYDPVKAKQLITEGGGIPGGQMKLGYNADSGSHKEWVDAVCNSINNVLGNNKACVGAPTGTFADFRNQITKGQMTQPFRSGWQMDYPLIDDFITPLYATGGSSNDSKYTNKTVDKLINQANAEPDTAKSIALYQQAEKQVLTDMPIVPLWYQNGQAGWSSKVSNVKENAFSYPIFTDITVN